MATEAQNLPNPSFPLSDLGPCELSCFNPFHRALHSSTLWVFLSRYKDELLRCHPQQRPLLFASKNGDPTMKDNIKCALQRLNLCFVYKPCLVQFWGLANIGDRRYLTTCDQPFALYWRRYLPDEVEGLCRYRKHCLEYLIAVDEPSVEEAELGPPGRVFRTGLPECVYDVSHCSSKEYPQRDLVIQCGMGYNALPVYQSRGNICIGVLEFLSSDYDAYIPVSEFHNSLKGHGVVGKAFSSQSACFCTDVRQLSITEDPSVPNARKCGYSSCFAICLRSSCSNSCIYTLEFVLPTNHTNSEDPRPLLHVIMEMLKQHLGSFFKVASGQELGQNLVVEVIKVSSDDKLDSFKICHATSGESTPRVVEVQNQVGMIPPDGSYQQVDVANNFVRDNNAQQNVIAGSSPTPELVQTVLSIRQPIEELDPTVPTRDDVSTEHNDSEAASSRIGGSAYTLESARGITLKDLQQRSAMKLVDAAKDLGVSRSSLKRISRGHSIHWWPPHTARKFNHAIDQQEFAQQKKTDLEDKVATRLNLPIEVLESSFWMETMSGF